jgi:hypothetical protein
MAFRVYKPRNLTKVQAEYVTTDSVTDLCKRLSGRLVYGENVRGEEPNITGFQVATFDGVKNFELGQWVVKTEEGDLGSMTITEFEQQYELARNTNGS